jgi:hypothetical protein
VEDVDPEQVVPVDERVCVDVDRVADGGLRVIAPVVDPRSNVFDDRAWWRQLCLGSPHCLATYPVVPLTTLTPGV